MKAAIYTEYGPPEVLKFTEIDKPVPKENEVLVKVHAFPVTAGDARIRAARFDGPFRLMGLMMFGFSKPKVPRLGYIFCGDVESVGSKVTRFSQGDTVYGSLINAGAGTNCEYLCMPADDVIALKPSNLTCDEAAAIPFGANTSLDFLKKANIKSGQHVLVNGASGSLGVYAVQLAKHFGATVTGVCGTSNMDLVRSLGVDKVIDYTKEDIAKSDGTYDIIYDTIGGISYQKTKHLLTKNGTYIAAVIGYPEIGAMFMTMFGGRKMIATVASESAENLEYINDLVEKGVIKPVIDNVYPFEEIVEAHRRVDSHHKVGSVVVSMK